MLKEIQKQLMSQNGRSTADPIFIVYDVEKVPSCSDYTDDWEYIDRDGGSRIGDSKEDLLKFIKDQNIDLPWAPCILKDMDGDDLLEFLNGKGGFELEKMYFIKKNVFKNVFFTEKAADQFIAQNHYHYSKEVHTYVACLWRNPEMQYIRDCLKKGLFKEVQDD